MAAAGWAEATAAVSSAGWAVDGAAGWGAMVDWAEEKEKTVDWGEAAKGTKGGRRRRAA